MSCFCIVVYFYNFKFKCRENSSSSIKIQKITCRHFLNIICSMEIFDSIIDTDKLLLKSNQ